MHAPFSYPTKKKNELDTTSDLVKKKYVRLLQFETASLICMGILVAVYSLLGYKQIQTTKAYHEKALADLRLDKMKLTESVNSLQSFLTTTLSDLATTSGLLATLSSELVAVKSENQYVTNRKLESELASIKQTFADASFVYEELVKLRESTTKTKTLEDAYAKILVILSERNYAEARIAIAKLRTDIQTQLAAISASFVIPANVAQSNSAPSSGYSRQQVTNDVGTFLVDIVAADMNSSRVIVDTASSSDCRDNCPVLSLGDYVSRSGAFAGINGGYFCPASYPSCQGKTNSFDTLLMNKNKTYFNSDNNVYSTVPAIIFLGSSMRVVGASQEWGRDTGIDGMIANQGLLLSGGTVQFGGDGDPKKGSRGSRSFVGSKGNIAYIGIVHNATVAEVARVLKTLGLENALNLDSGGSTALWANGGYKAGPGRGIPNAVLFVRK